MARWIIVDGLLQARPTRVGTSILVLDGDRPFGAGYCPPRGDLRASIARLGRASDVVLLVAGSADLVEVGALLGRPVLRVESELMGARCPNGRLVPMVELAATRLGLALGMARPERVIEALGHRGVAPALVMLARDHDAPPRPGPGQPGVVAWLTTAKCSTKLGDYWSGAPVWVLERRLRLPPELAAFWGGAHACDSARSW
jgi:tetraacyldisaccharide 4'-kinase